MTGLRPIEESAGSGHFFFLLRVSAVGCYFSLLDFIFFSSLAPFSPCAYALGLLSPTDGFGTQAVR